MQVYDTTLRDGAQREAISYSVVDKLAVARLLDEFGVGFIEGGWPGAMPKDTEFFRRARTELDLKHAVFVAFGATRKAGVPVQDDQVAQHAEELADKIDRLLTTQVSSAAPIGRQLTGLRECCDRWQVAVASPPDSRVLGRLATTTIELCTALLDMTEEDHG